MSPKLIVSYDDTHNDQDALALGRVLGDAGASIALAYVSHQPVSERMNKPLDEPEAEALLARGAAQLGLSDAPRHVVVNASTPDGLRQLAERERADIVVFGSEYRTAEGSVQPGTSAQRLLDGGPVAIAIAPAGLRSRRPAAIARIGILDEAGDPAVAESARTLAHALGATIADPGSGAIDLLVIGSRAAAADHQVLLSATAAYAIDTASYPVFVLPRHVPVRFGVPAAA